MANTDVPSECPYCGQTLMNEAAVRHLRQREEQIQLKYAKEAEVKVKQLLAAAHEQLEKKVRSDYDKKEKARERTMAALQQQNAELQRQLEKLTAHERGDAQEIDIFESLKQAFPDDQIERHSRGGDIVQSVWYEAGRARQRAGVIVYECKDTLRWNNEFVAQINKAGQAHGSPYLILVTRAFPAGEKDLCVRGNVIIAPPAKASLVAEVVRRMVIAVHRAGLKAEGQAEKTSQLYGYLTGDEFRTAFDYIVTAADELDRLLGAEKLAHERTWKRREQVYSDVGRKMAAIDEGIRAILEASGSAKAKVIPLRRQARA